MPTADYPHQVDKILEAIDSSDSIHIENAELLFKYRRDKQLGEMSPATQQRNLAYLKKVAEHAGETRFDVMDADDVKDIIVWVKGRDLADETVDTYKKAISSFWRWLRDANDEPPAEVAWIKFNGKSASDTLPTDLLTKEEIRAQINACTNDRDKAFIALLYETGARIGELIDLELGAIEDRKRGKKVVIDGKTGPRRVPLVESVPYLNEWIRNHPDPRKEAPIWCKLSGGSESISYDYIRQKLLRRSLRRAGIDKPCNPHHYRHSRASFLANHMTEAQLCEWFGWVQGSDIPAKYVHLSGRDLDTAYDGMHGLVDPEDDGDEPDVIECFRCQELNEPDAAFCKRCGAALDADAANEVEVTERKSAQSATPDHMTLAVNIAKAIENPETAEELEELLAKME